MKERHRFGVKGIKIDTPLVDHKNSSSDNIRNFSEDDKFDVIIMNPSFGSKSDEESIKVNFQPSFRQLGLLIYLWSYS